MDIKTPKSNVDPGVKSLKEVNKTSLFLFYNLIAKSLDKFESALSHLAVVFLFFFC